jgi:hypothetical protein
MLSNRHLHQLLTGTGVCLPDRLAWFEREEVIWSALFLVHSLLLVGLLIMISPLSAGVANN